MTDEIKHALLWGGAGHNVVVPLKGGGSYGFNGCSYHDTGRPADVDGQRVRLYWHDQPCSCATPDLIDGPPPLAE